MDAEANENSTRLEQGKSEASDGQEVVGVYKVLLPDGNLQTVTYTAGPDGYKANVRYSKVEEPVHPRTISDRSRARVAPDEDADANRVHPLNHHFQDDDSSERAQFRQRSNRIRAEKHRTPHGELGNDSLNGSRSELRRSGAKSSTRRIRH